MGELARFGGPGQLPDPLLLFARESAAGDVVVMPCSIPHPLVPIFHARGMLEQKKPSVDY